MRSEERVHNILAFTQYNVHTIYTDPGFQLYECFDDSSIKHLIDKEFLKTT